MQFNITLSTDLLFNALQWFLLLREKPRPHNIKWHKEILKKYFENVVFSGVLFLGHFGLRKVVQHGAQLCLIKGYDGCTDAQSNQFCA